MRIPFLHTAASGVYITRDAVTWAMLERTGPRLGQVHLTVEAIQEDQVQVALCRLVERVRPPHPFVVSHLDASHVRHEVLRGPAFDDDESLQAWIRTEIPRRLPRGARMQDFVVRSHVVEATEDFTRVQIALARAEAVEARLGLLQQAGLSPVSLGSVDVAVGYALAFEPAFLEGEVAALVVRPDEATQIAFRNGLLQEVVPMPCGAHQAEALAEALVATPGKERGERRFFVVGTAAEQVVTQMQALLLNRVVQGEIVLGRSAQVAARHIPPVALALKQAFPALDQINFLPPEVVSDRQQQHDKKEALRAMAWVGSSSLAATLVLMLSLFVLGRQEAATATAFAQRAEQVAEVEQARRDLTALRQEVEQAERLVQERTHVAAMLAQVGRVVPEHLWLRSLALTVRQPATQLTLIGQTFSEADLALYLARLEQHREASNVRLIYAERGRKARQGAPLSEPVRPMTRFEIQLGLTPSFPETE